MQPCTLCLFPISHRSAGCSRAALWFRSRAAYALRSVKASSASPVCSAPLSASHRSRCALVSERRRCAASATARTRSRVVSTCGSKTA
eukprot:1870799-Prymnesium_polylepis.1